MKDLFLSFGLSYHYLHLTDAMAECGPVKEKRVLEVGGCLPRRIVIDELGAAQWIGIDFPGYWEESGDQNPSRRIDVERAGLAGFSPNDAQHICLEGDVADLPASFDGQFDFVFSTSALEHVADLPATLAAISRILKPGGKLYAVAMRLWLSSTGHHLPPVYHQGKVFGFEQEPIPPWAHLYLTPAELTAHLALSLPEEVVEQVIYQCYSSPQINRALPEDYEMALLAAPFSGRKILRIYEAPAPDEIQARLERIYGQRRFDQWGVSLIADR